MGVGRGLQNSHFLRKESCVYVGGGASKPSAQLISENVSLLPIIPKFPREREGRDENFMVSWLQLISGLVSFYFQGFEAHGRVPDSVRGSSTRGEKRDIHGFTDFLLISSFLHSLPLFLLLLRFKMFDLK